MGHKYTREQILEGAVELALAEGVGSLTFGRLAKRMGTSDRVIVYYFPSKTTLVSDVLVEIGNQLQAVLAKAFTEPAAGHRQLAKAAYGVLARDDTDAIFAVYFEACGLAAAGAQPFGDLAAALVEGGSVGCPASSAATPNSGVRRPRPRWSLIDGVLLMRQLAGAQAADRAAKALGLNEAVLTEPASGSATAPFGVAPRRCRLSGPANDSRTNEPPCTVSKSIPGAIATPVSANSFAQNARESEVKSEMSA